MMYKIVGDRRWRQHDPVRRHLYASDTVIHRMQKQLLVGEDGFASSSVSENPR
jgi:hypothetical protein